MNAGLENYLYSRGLVKPAEVVQALMEGKKDVPVGADILADDELLAQVAGLYMDKRKALEAVIAARLLPMVMELSVKAFPQETIVIRQSMVDIISLLDDFARYTAEYQRRTKEKDAAQTEVDKVEAGRNEGFSHADNAPDNNSPPQGL